MNWKKVSKSNDTNQFPDLEQHSSSTDSTPIRNKNHMQVISGQSPTFAQTKPVLQNKNIALKRQKP